MPQEPTQARSQSAANVTSHNATEADPGLCCDDNHDRSLMGFSTEIMGVKHAKEASDTQRMKTENLPRDVLIHGLSNNDSRSRLGFSNSTTLDNRPKSSSIGPKGSDKDLQRIRHQFPQKQIHVIKIKSWIDKKMTTVDESSSGVLKYKTPHFRASATVDLPALHDGERLQLGWIQTCINMNFVNTYGEKGLTSWEFPELVSGKYDMISDADGRAYPWYGAKKEIRTHKGPCDRQIVSVEMNDNFFPQVTWHIPEEGYDRKPRLTQVHRKQQFYTCLAVRDCLLNRIYIYKTITWTMELNIKVNPEKPLGQRAHVERPYLQDMPRILRKNIEPPVHALKPPNANRSQALVWRPFGQDPRLVVTPTETTVNMEEYLKSTQHLVEKLREQHITQSL